MKKIGILIIIIFSFFCISLVHAEGLEDGDYVISSSINPLFNIDLDWGKTTNENNIQIYSQNDNNAQVWHFEQQPDGYYVISSAFDHSYVFDVANAKFESWNNVWIYKYNGSNAQKWKVIQDADGYYMIESYDQDYVLEVKNANVVNNGNIQIYRKNCTPAQRFSITKRVTPGNKVLKNGIYSIQSSSLNNAISVDKKLANGKDINLTNNSADTNQLWYVEYLNNGYYIIKSLLNEDFVFDVTNARKVRNTNLQIYKINKSNAQQWVVKPTEDGYFNIISRCNGLYLDNNDSNSVVLNEKTGTASQKFQFLESQEPNIVDLEDGDYVISSSINPLFNIDLDWGKTTNGNNIQIYSQNDNNAQVWHFEQQPDGYYVISSAFDHSYVFDVANAKFESWNNVWIYKYNGSNAQKWRIKSTEDGYYMIESYDRNYVLEIKNANVANNENIQIYKKNYTPAQKFSITKKSIPGSKILENGIYTISNPNNTSNIDLESGINNQSKLVMSSPTDSYTQKWYLEYLNNGYYRIRSLENINYSFDVANGLKIENTPMQLYTNNSSNAQQFVIKKTSDEYYNIISRNNSLALTSDDNSKIVLNTLVNSTNQKFKFNRIDNFGTQTIKDGYYFINTRLNQKKSIEVSDGLYNNGQNVQIYDSNSTIAQKWHIKYIGDGYYTILTNNDKFALTSESIDSSNITIKKYTGLATQKWIIRTTSNGYYNIVNSNYYSLDVANAKTNNRNNVQLWSYNNSDAQQFKLVYTAEGSTLKKWDNGYYFITSAIDDNYVVDLANANTSNRSNIWAWSLNRSDAQKWYMSYSNNGYYNIMSGLNLIKSLDVAGAGTTSGTNLQLFDYNNSYAQQWVIKDAGDGYYYILSNSNGLYLTINSSTMANGANIYLGEYTGQANQKFKFTRTRLEKLVIDVSAHNGDIDWKQVSESGIYGAILRVAASAVSEDVQLANNIYGVKKYNIPYGVYIYSYAENYDEGVIYGDYLSNILSKYSLHPSLGIYLDLESNRITAYMGTEHYTNVVRGFTSVIPDAKIYTYKNYADSALNTEYLRSLITWIAQYNTQCTYGGSYNMWQYTSSGSVPGISTNVDMSIYYQG